MSALWFAVSIVCWAVDPPNRRATEAAPILLAVLADLVASAINCLDLLVYPASFAAFAALTIDPIPFNARTPEVTAPAGMMDGANIFAPS